MAKKRQVCASPAAESPGHDGCSSPAAVIFITMAGMVHIAKERVPIAQLQLTEDEVQRETGEGHHQSLFETVALDAHWQCYVRLLLEEDAKLFT